MFNTNCIVFAIKTFIVVKYSHFMNVMMQCVYVCVTLHVDKIVYPMSDRINYISNATIL